MIVTANTPPNLNQLTDNRLKLMTLFLVRNKSGKMIDSFLLPVFIKISVRIIKLFPNNLEYCFTVIPESFEFYSEKYKDFSWFNGLIDNVKYFEEFKLTPEYDLQSKMVSKWTPTSPYNLQSDILSFYYKTLVYFTTVKSNESFIEGSSMNDFKVYSIKEEFKIN